MGLNFFFKNFHYLSTLFCQNFEGYNIERKNEIERQYLVHMSTILNNKIKWIETFFSEYLLLVHLSTFFGQIFEGYKVKIKNKIEREHCVHMSTFSVKFWRYKKERKHKIERHLFKIFSPKTQMGLTLSPWGGDRLCPPQSLCLT